MKFEISEGHLSIERTISRKPANAVSRQSNVIFFTSFCSTESFSIFKIHRNSLNFPTIEHQESSSEEISPNTIKDASSSIERILQEHEDFPQKQTPLRQRAPLIENMKSYQIMRLNKANFEQ